MATFKLEIKTPDKVIFSGDIESLIVPFSEGKEGFLAKHENVLKPLSKGTIEYKTADSQEFDTLDVSEGWLSFSDNKAIILISE